MNWMIAINLFVGVVGMMLINVGARACKDYGSDNIRFCVGLMLSTVGMMFLFVGTRAILLCMGLA